MTLEVVHRHEKLAPESGVEFMAPISGAYVMGFTFGSFVICKCVRRKVTTAIHVLSDLPLAFFPSNFPSNSSKVFELLEPLKTYPLAGQKCVYY